MEEILKDRVVCSCVSSIHPRSTWRSWVPQPHKLFSQFRFPCHVFETHQLRNEFHNIFSNGKVILSLNSTWHASPSTHARQPKVVTSNLLVCRINSEFPIWKLLLHARLSPTTCQPFVSCASLTSNFRIPPTTF